MQHTTLSGRSFLTLFDFNHEEISYLLRLSKALKQQKKLGKEEKNLKGKNIALIFEKTSTRTRCAFEVASFDQGACTTYLDPVSTQIGHKESIKDTARVLGRMYDAILYRGYDQSIVEELALHAGIPVWNGLTDQYHPTQIIADLLTMEEHSDKPLQELSVAFLGDIRNNVSNSLMIGCSIMGMDLRLVGPDVMKPDDIILKKCLAITKHSGGKIVVTKDIQKGVMGCDYIYTDVWVSMGEDENTWNQRIEQLKPYQVNKEVISLSGNIHCKFLHCLPAFHNRDTLTAEKLFQLFGMESLEVTDEVFESEASLVFDQAENRMHTIKAIMVATLI